MKRSLCIALAASALLAAAPVIAQTEQQQARESTGEANTQKQLGGLKHDRQITLPDPTPRAPAPSHRLLRTTPFLGTSLSLTG